MSLLRAEKFWDKNAEKYSKSPIRDQETYEKKLATSRKYFSTDSNLLEFGCGTGSTALLHAPHAGHVTAIDVSGKMIEIARAKAEAEGIANVTFKRAALEEFDPQQQQFDAVLGLNILHLLDDLQAMVESIYALTKPGGVFISSTVCLGDAGLAWRILVPLAKLVGLAPPVYIFKRPYLEQVLTEAGFVLEENWESGAVGSAFIVARKPGGAAAPGSTN